MTQLETKMETVNIIACARLGAISQGTVMQATGGGAIYVLGVGGWR